MTSARRLDDLTPEGRRSLLAEMLREKATRERVVGGGGLPVVAPAWGKRFEPFPLTDVQLAYWVGRGGSFELGNVAAHVYVEWDLPGLDVGRVESVWRTLIERHDMLRAVVRADGQQQVLASVPRYEVAVLDVRGLEPQAASAALAGVREELSHQVLPADRWPLFDGRVSLLAGDRMRLHTSIDLLIVDFLSIQILLREWAALYFFGEELPPLELSFRDYVLAERGLRDSARARRARSYWEQRLPDLPAAPELPLACAPGLVERPRFQRYQSRLEPHAWLGLKRWARTEGVTPSAVLLTAFADVLAVWSREPRFTINLTLFNRLPVHPQVGALVGDFTSLTLLAVEAAADVSFLDRARRLQAQLWSDLDHREYSGVRVLRELMRDTGQAAVMPVVFTSTLTQGLVEADSVPVEVTVELAYVITQTPQVWLDHQVSEQGGALVFSWDVVEELFPPGLIAAMFAAYCGLLERLSASPDASASRRLRRLVPSDQLTAQAQANATATPRPPGLLHDGFLAQAQRCPEALAVAAPGLQLRYGELQRRASLLARELRRRGVRPGRLVAVVMQKGWEQALAVLAVLEAGGAYLPLDPALPRERLHSLLEHGEVEQVLTQSPLARRLVWPAGICLLALDEYEPEGTVEPLPATASAADLAYVIYTSGSTGLPKGVMIEHRAALNTILDINHRFTVGPHDRVLALSALGFDLSVYDLFGTFSAGGTVVMPAAAAERDPMYWLQLVREERVSVWNSVPALAQLLLDRLENAAEPSAGELRLILLSGDWIPLELARRLRALLPHARVVGLGGATEAGIWSVCQPIERIEPDWTGIPYGRPLANQRLHVLDEALEPRPLLVPGQLYIAGDGLARGYWRDKERTRASFLHHPERGERLYRTGDLARHLPDGTLEFLGREDFQVKVHAYRIELGEIEAALATHPAVHATVVDVLDGQRGSKHLVAYVVPAPGPPPDPAELRRHLDAKLPPYMVPHHYLTLDSLPLTANGKLDRRVLPAPDTPQQTGAPHAAPRNEREQLLADIWSDLLHSDHIGIHDNFFTLGGDSLLAIELLARVRQSSFVLAPADFLNAQTIAGAAAAMRSAPPVLAEQEPVVGPLPTTPIQRWFFELDLPNPERWNFVLLLEPRQPLDPVLVQAALRRVVEHHDALRLRAQRTNGLWRQEIAPPDAHFPYPVVTLSHSEGDPEVLLDAWDTDLDLGLARGPLLRAALVDREDGGQRLLLVVHHLAVDGVSLRVLVEDLQLAYAQLGAQREPTLPLKTSSYRDWSERLVEYAQSEDARAELTFWLELLPTSVAPLPRDHIRGSSTLASIRSLSVSLDVDEAPSLLHGHPDGASVDEVLLAALAHATRSWTGLPSLLVDVTAHGREPVFDDVDVSRTVGWFSALYPFFVEVPQAGDLDAVLSSVSTQRRRIPRGGIGYGVLRYLCDDAVVRTQLTSRPQAEIVLNYIGRTGHLFAERSLFASGQLSLGTLSGPTGVSSYPLQVVADISAGALRVEWVYHENVHRSSTIERVATDFLTAVRVLSRSGSRNGGLSRRARRATVQPR